MDLLIRDRFSLAVCRNLPVVAALICLLLLDAFCAHAQSFAIVHSFRDGTVAPDGISPYASLVQGTDGNLYGTTINGGSTAPLITRFGDGTVFRMTLKGKVTILHSFQDGTVKDDGKSPAGGLILGSDGNFYGTTDYGGSTVNRDPEHDGYGTVYRITPTGKVTILHSFGDGSVKDDGITPDVALVRGSDGNFYGTTEGGGSADNGTIFRITPSGHVTILHSFQDGTVAGDGEGPQTGLIQGSDGDFYGTTGRGGSTINQAEEFHGLGTVFRMTKSGHMTILHSFRDGSVKDDGASPSTGLLQGSDGNFYGATQYGGSTATPGENGKGTVFRITPAGKMTILHSFGDGTVANDGKEPTGLYLDRDGNFYGTTGLGGSGVSPTSEDGSGGTVFLMTPSGRITILHSFRDGSIANDGEYPNAGVIRGSDGSYYGTTSAGGRPKGIGDGTVFRVTTRH